MPVRPVNAEDVPDPGRLAGLSTVNVRTVIKAYKMQDGSIQHFPEFIFETVVGIIAIPLPPDAMRHVCQMMLIECEGAEKMNSGVALEVATPDVLSQLKNITQLNERFRNGRPTTGT